jgi:hypothetical protein
MTYIEMAQNSLVEDLAHIVKYDRKADAAKAAHKIICEHVRASGQDPKWEVMIKNPEETLEHIGSKNWWVCWECGPTSWGVEASMSLVMKNEHWYCETYWGFDLIFCDS